MTPGYRVYQVSGVVREAVAITVGSDQSRQSIALPAGRHITAIIIADDEQEPVVRTTTVAQSCDFPSEDAEPNSQATLMEELAEVIELALDAGAWDYGSETKLLWVDRLEELTGVRWEGDEEEFEDFE